MNLFSKWNADALGIGASLLCAVHCALLPLLTTALPLLGIGLLEHEGWEFGLLGFSFLMGYLALFRGYQRRHRHPLPLVLFTVGFAGLLIGHFFSTESSEPFIITAGAALIIWAHWRNLRQARHCKVCADEGSGHTAKAR
ncbi:MerC domain-containing protein [Chitinophaga lutea]